MNLVILGPQGSGKGTQAELLSERLGLYRFEMGSFLRDLAKTDPLVDKIMNKEGKLVPDDMFLFAMKALLEGKIKEGKSFILDGFPRTIRQYETLKNWLVELSIKIDKVIFLNISQSETIRRLSNRRVCKSCGKIWNLSTASIPPTPQKCECSGELFQRVDDQPKQIKRRLEEYRRNTEPLLKVLKKDGLLIEINGEGPIAEIHQKIYEKILPKN